MSKLNISNSVWEVFLKCGVKKEEVTIKESGVLAQIEITMGADSDSTKLNKNAAKIGLMLGSKMEPSSYYDYNIGKFVILVQHKSFPEYSFEDISSKVTVRRSEQPIILGVSAKTEILSPSLISMPHMIIGGIPGSGKSMLLHSIVLSLAKTNTDIYLADPKMVEFPRYKNLQNVVNISESTSDFIENVSHLNSVMMTRFEKYKKTGCSNIFEYKEKVEHQNFITLIVDEWADLVLSQPKKVIDPIVTLAQKGRAAGISIILATQRPSSKVFPGLIKASFPAKIAMKTSSALESRIILDSNGAETLSEVGTGLFLNPKNNQKILFRSPKMHDLNSYISSCRQKSIINSAESWLDSWLKKWF